MPIGLLCHVHIFTATICLHIKGTFVQEPVNAIFYLYDKDLANHQPSYYSALQGLLRVGNGGVWLAAV